MSNNDLLWELPAMDDPYPPTGVRLAEWPVVLERWTEVLTDPDARIAGVLAEAFTGLTVEVEGYRPATLDDVDVADLTGDVWDWLGEALLYHDDLSHEDGSPVLSPLSTDDGRQLEELLAELLRKHLDLSEAACQPTGRVRRIAPDGTWTEVEP